MGVIVKVVDNDIRRPVAMKVILGEDNRNRLERFVEEAQVTGQLEHPNIVPVHEIGIDEGGKVYFTMKLVGGESLESILDAIADEGHSTLHRPYGDNFPLSRLLQIFLKVCDAVSFAHSRGVLHRDLKPENVMVGDFGEVLVMDWGLAKVGSKEATPSRERVGTIRSEKEMGRTLDGDILGTPSYMPPEQADGRIDELDERSDVFALGGILYRILTHVAPYTGETVENVLLKAVVGEVVRPRKRSPWNHIPPELEAICLKAMAKERSRRYVNVRALVDDILSFQERRPVASLHYSAFRKIILWIQRNPTFSLVGSLTTFLVLTGCSVAWVLAEKARQAELERSLAEERAAQSDLERELAHTRALKAEAEVSGQQESENLLLKLKSLRRGPTYDAAARAILEEASKAAGGYWKPHLLLAKHHADLGRHEDAEVEFTRANDAYRDQFGRDSQEIWFETGMYYGLPDELGGPGREKKALEYFHRAHACDPGTPHGKLARAIGLVIEASLEPVKADAQLEEAIRLSDELSEDVIAVNLEATWLVRGWIFGISVFVSFQTPALTRVADFEKAGEALDKVANRTVVSVAFLNFYGNVLEELGRHEEAIGFFNRCIEVSPQPGLYNNRGTAYCRLGLAKEEEGHDGAPYFRKALQEFEEGLKRDRDFGVLHANKGLALMHLGAALSKSGEDPASLFEKALESMREALRLSPDYVNGRSALGELYRRRGEYKSGRGDDPDADYDSALEAYQEALRHRPGISRYHAEIGRVHYLRGTHAQSRGGDTLVHFRLAVKACDEALRLDPNNSEARSNRALMNDKIGQVEAGRGADPRESFLKSIEDYSESISKNSSGGGNFFERGLAWANLAQAQGRRGEDPGNSFDKAVADFRASLKRGHKPIDSLNNCATAHALKARFEASAKQDARSSFAKAIAVYGEVLKDHPGHAPALMRRGVVHRDLAEHLNQRGSDPFPAFSDAIADMTEALQIDPGSVSGWYERGVTHDKLSVVKASRGGVPKTELKRAIRDFSEALKRNPAHAGALNDRGRTHMNLGKVHEAAGEYRISHYEKAVADLEEAVKLDPRSWRAYYNLGGAYERARRYDPALAALEKVKAILGQPAPELEQAIARVRTALEKGRKDR
jgi:serine/threonine protein kinase/Flp pilus assembly protein TadD